MYRLYCLVMLASGVLVAGSDLCGPADARVCLENTTYTTVNGVQLLPGTSIVFTVPGVKTSSSTQTTGTPSRPYRLALNGTVTDDQGGVWSEAEPLDEDLLGYPAIRFVLLEGSLFNVQLELEGLRVCQRVIDGPGEIEIGIAFWAATNKRARKAYSTKMAVPGFDLCKNLTAPLATPEQGMTLYVVNPLEEAAAISLAGEMMRIEPGERLELPIPGADLLRGFSTSLDLPALVFTDVDDYNVVGVRRGGGRDQLFPHIARDGASWDNTLVLAGDQAMSLSLRTGTENSATYLPAGNNTSSLTASPTDRAAFVRATGTASFASFLSLTRRDSGGGAFVGPVPIESGRLGSEMLYIPHVAADSASFWTGYSLANPYTHAVDVRFRAHGHDGAILGEESNTMPPRSNDVGVIGGHRFPALVPEEIAWIAIEASDGLAGIELVGAARSEEGNLSGFLLPGETSARLAFPLLRSGEGDWSGLALLNPRDETATVTVLLTDAAGYHVETQTLTLEPYTKALITSPERAVAARVTGAELVGFCLTGSATGRLGAYLAKGY